MSSSSFFDLKGISLLGKLKPFISYFDLSEYRKIGGTFTYPLFDLLLCTLFGVLSGGCSQRQIADNVKRCEADILPYLQNRAGSVPKRSTLDGFLQSLDLQLVRKGYKCWVADLFSLLGLRQIEASIDGKVIFSDSGKVNTKKANTFLCVSVFSHLLGVCLDFDHFQRAFTTELRVANRLIGEQEGVSLITSDAGNVWQQTLKEMQEVGVTYLFAVKNNCKVLVRDLCQQSLYLESGAHRDRFYKRSLDCYEVKANFQTKPKDAREVRGLWKECGISRFYILKRQRIGGRDQTFYYISNGTGGSQKVLEQIKNHWKIENNLHKEIDMIYKQDYFQHPNFQTKSALSVLFNIAVSLFNLFKCGTIKVCPREIYKYPVIFFQLMGLN